MNESKRPVGVSLLAVLLILFAFNGLSSLFGSTQVLSEWFAKATFPDYFYAACAVCAAFTAIALWEMRRWAIHSYWIWAILTIVGHAIHDTILKTQGTTNAQWWQIAVGPVIIAVVHTLIGKGLQTSLKRSA
jgi:hypothetical protein